MNELEEYYQKDELAMSVWQGKYAMNTENTPDDMHQRIAKELVSVEMKYSLTESAVHIPSLSEFGKNFYQKYAKGSHVSYLDLSTIYQYISKYKYIVPQGSIMSVLGNKNIIGSLSNCFVIPPPVDSYGGIFKTDQQIAQLEKRRGGVGTNLNTLRPENSSVSNAAKTSTGAHSFMDRYSNTTREVAQNGRRGALMLLMSCQHPDIFKFVTKKADLTKVTGANVSVMLTDVFMKAVSEDGDFICTFPVISGFDISIMSGHVDYNTLYKYNSSTHGWMQIMKIKAKELYDLIVEMAWKNAEPGIAFIDRIENYCPEGVYEQFRPIASNPCGEQWMQAYDACRLLALNFYNVVEKHFTEGAKINYDTLYEISYIQQRLADNIVDLEIDYVDRIINKIKSDGEPEDVKATELTLWKNIKQVAESSRRTGCGFTALADMLAAINLKYDSPEALATVKEVMKTKFRGELDCTIDLAVTRGPFKGWDKTKEFDDSNDILVGKNDFYKMMAKEFPKETERMTKFGRRNVSWSTVAPTGSVSIVSLLSKYPNTSAGCEPHFSLYHFRNKKINPSDENQRIDFTDQNGDHWQTHAVIMGGLKEWMEINEPQASYIGQDLKEEHLKALYEKSPYYKSSANDICWEKRVEMQSIIQKYTTNAVSSTLNLPNDVTQETVSKIYKEAWDKGLKGITVYRDGSRTGVMTTKKTGGFEYKDSIKRPKELDADLSIVSVKGVKYAVIVGIIDNLPYEVFAFNLPDEIKESCTGKIIKVKKGHYNFVCDNIDLKNIQEIGIRNDELVLTRLISGMLRHGAKPQFVMEQIDKCNLEIVSFGKAVSRILKKYVADEDLEKRTTCKDCGGTNVRMQEGCMTCTSCGSSKCG